MTGRVLTFDWSSDFTSSNFNMQPSQLSYAFTIYRRNVKVKKGTSITISGGRRAAYHAVGRLTLGSLVKGSSQMDD